MNDKENKDIESKKGEFPPLKEMKKQPLSWKAILVLALVSWFLVSFLFQIFGSSNRLKLSYTEFKDKVTQGQVSEITVKGDQVTGQFKKTIEGEPVSTILGKRVPNYDAFKTTLPPFRDEELMGLLEKNKVVIRAESEERSWLWTLLVSFLPWLLIIGFFVWSSKRFQQKMGGMGSPFGFGKSKAKLYTESTSNVTFDDVAGLANTKRELQEVVAFLKEPSKFKSLGGELPRGILLVGPPGVGKTLMSRAVAGEAGVPFYSISGSEFIEMFVGVGASRVRDMFKNAKEKAPSIIFIDELDSIGRVRGTGLGGGHDEREQTLNQILSEMDGFASHESVVVISATNRPDVLDPALTRPGRFDRQISLELPQKNARKEILETRAREIPLADDVDLETLAAKTVGFSGADLKNLVNEAALMAARREKKKVEAQDFDDAKDKIIMGVEREDAVREEEREVIAYHEAGHALVAKLLPEADPLEKVTIIPRGRTLGATEQVPEEDRQNLSKHYLLNRIAIMLGGRAAEKLQFDDITTGGGDDLKKATQVARRMVCQWGMSEKVGPVTFRQGEPHPFLGREMTEPKDFSEKTAQIIDEETRRLITEMEVKATEILTSNREGLDAVAVGLMEHETLSKEEVEEILDSVEASEEKKEAAN
jgi:cell division protease FtsH